MKSIRVRAESSETSRVSYHVGLENAFLDRKGRVQIDSREWRSIRCMIKRDARRFPDRSLQKIVNHLVSTKSVRRTIKGRHIVVSDAWEIHNFS